MRAIHRSLSLSLVRLRQRDRTADKQGLQEESSPAVNQIKQKVDGHAIPVNGDAGRGPACRCLPQVLPLVSAPQSDQGTRGDLLLKTSRTPLLD